MIQCDKCKGIQKSSLKSDEFIPFMNMHFCWPCWGLLCDVVKEWAKQPTNREVKQE